jgi:hypothetical protein
MPSPAQSPEDVVLLREVLARSLEGLTRCEAWANAGQDPKVRALLSSFATTERERFATALALLQELEGVGPAPRAAAEPLPEPEAPPAPPGDRGAQGPLASPLRAMASVEAAPGPITGRLTVGSLRTRGGTTHA